MFSPIASGVSYHSDIVLYISFCSSDANSFSENREVVVMAVLGKYSSSISEADRIHFASHLAMS